MERNSVNALHGQITIGTLILQVLVAPNYDLNCNNFSPYQWKLNMRLDYQDCCVGLLFALLPVLGGGSGVFHGVISMLRS